MDASHSVVGEISFADLCLNRSTREVRCAGRSVVVKYTSCKVLEQLFASAGAVVTRQSLLLHVWGFDFDPGTKVLEVQVSYIRGVLIGLGSAVSIKARRKVGYQMRVGYHPFRTQR